MSKTAIDELLVLLDNEQLYEAVARELTKARSAFWKQSGARRPVTVMPQGGSFARGCTVAGNGFTINLIHLSPANAHPLGFLTLLEMQQRCPLSRILAVGEGFSLRRDLRAGDLAFVTRASALPYPALLANRPPAWQAPDFSQSHPESFTAATPSDGALDIQTAQGESALWQKDLPAVHAAYTRHPQWAGAQPPWAPEQFERLRTEEQVDVLAELPAGVLEFAEKQPEILVHCLCMVIGQAFPSSSMAEADPLAALRRDFYRHQRRGVVPAANFLLRYLASVTEQAAPPLG